MTSDTPAAPRRFIELSDFRFRLWPILAGGLLMEGLLRLGRVPAWWLWHHGPPDWADRPWIYVAAAILFQALIGLVVIALMKRLLPSADAHLRLPAKGRSLAGLAVLLGIVMGLVMLAADYWPNLFTHVVPNDYPTDPVNASGWLFAMGITGFAEETLFRGFLLGALAVLVPGRLRIGALDLPVAAYFVASIFGAMHWQSFFVNPLHLAIAQQLYAFAWGLIYVWLMERSDSLLAPVIAHGASDFAEVGMVMLLTATLAP